MRPLLIFPSIVVAGFAATSSLALVTGDLMSAALLVLVLAVTIASVAARVLERRRIAR